MQYLLLIYGSEREWAKKPVPEQTAIHREYRQLIQELVESGKFLAGDQLHPSSTATTVRVRNAKRVLTDGPFAESKEHLGGFFLVEVKDLDEALAIAVRIPSARDGSIEVRPIVVREQMKSA